MIPLMRYNILTNFVWLPWFLLFEVIDIPICTTATTGTTADLFSNFIEEV